MDAISSWTFLKILIRNFKHFPYQLFPQKSVVWLVHPSVCFSFMLLVFLEYLVIDHSYERLDHYILVSGLESSPVVKVTIHPTGFLSECDRAMQVNGWECANRRIAIYEAWIGNKLQSEVGKVSY